MGKACLAPTQAGGARGGVGARCIVPLPERQRGQLVNDGDGLHADGQLESTAGGRVWGERMGAGRCRGTMHRAPAGAAFGPDFPSNPTMDTRTAAFPPPDCVIPFHRAFTCQPPAWSMLIRY